MAKQQAKKKALPVKEEAWASDSVWSGAWEKYNPDDLISRRGFGIYKKMMLDEQVKACVHFKRNAITSRDHFFEFDDAAQEALSDEEKLFRIRLSQKIVSNVKGSFTDKLNGIMSSNYNGFSLSEKLPVQFEYEGKTYWGLKDIKLKPFDTFEFHTDEYDNVEKVVQRVASNELTINLAKFVHMVNQPDVDRHYGQSELREAYRAWFSKDKAILHYNIYLERCASGFKVISARQGQAINKDTQEYRDLQNVLDNTTAGNGMILPGKVEFTVYWPEGKVEYPRAIEMYDLMIARALLVPNLLGFTPQGQYGSYGQGDIQLESFLWVLDSDTSRLEEIVNEDMFRELGEINFGDDYWPRFKFKPLSDRKLIEIIKEWRELVKANTVKATEKDEDHIRNILEFPERTEEDELLNEQPASPDSDDTGVPGNVPADDKPSENNPGQNPQKEPTKGDVQEETLNNGDYRRLYGAALKAQKRVAFAVIANTTDAMEYEYARDVSKHLYEATERALADTDVQKADFKFTSGDKQKMQRIVGNALNEAWTVGQRHAAMEIDKAKGATYTSKQDFTAVEKDFVKLRSFKAAGKLTDDAKAIVENAILQGVKAGKSFDQIRLDIYAAYRSAGLLTEELDEALGEALAGRAAGSQVVNSQARIDTMLRTNVYEALNEARFAYFQDPGLQGFVQAYEYSAILDNRTTQICRALDGKVFAAGSEVWDTYRPTNHYNCRSLMIPIVEGDAWTEDAVPDIEPQRGFA